MWAPKFVPPCAAEQPQQSVSPCQRVYTGTTFLSVRHVVILCLQGGWLKLKYHTRQNAISQQPSEICLPKFQDFKTFKCHCSLNINK